MARSRSLNNVDNVEIPYPCIDNIDYIHEDHNNIAYISDNICYHNS